MMTILKRTTAMAALAALPLAPIAVQAQSQDTGQETQAQQTQTQTQQGQAQTSQDQSAQQSGQTGETQAEGTQQSGQTDQAQTQDESTGEQQAVTGTGQEEDAVVARVGDTDIMRSEVLSVIGTLPPNMQEQPAETLIPLAVEQLVLRELILQEAREAGLENDPDVALLTGDPDAPEEARENAMVQVWLDRELEGSVTDQAVQDTYGQVQSELGDQAPPLEQIRPQIEQEVRRQAFAEISDELHSDADVTLFGPDGEPIE